eukprot:Seg1044.6 transcript_id=Seg1044.6/GoldUCD/mRNA.D3Y31 product="Demethylmenaquinone methyltransferase" protein_id=Seg1044.6/GoldUCD/D3Y31
MEPGDAAEGYLKHSKSIKEGQYDGCKVLLAKTDIKPGDNVFEIGCGTGEYAAYLAKDVLKDGHITACDPDQNRIAVAQTRFGNLTNLTYIHAGGSDALEGKLGVSDVVYSSAVLHWMSDEELEKTFQKSFLAMKNGAVAAHHGIYQQADYTEKFVPYFSEDLKKVFYNMLRPTPVEKLTNLLQKHGYKVLKADQYFRSTVFPTLDVFLNWLDSTWYGKFGIKDLYKKFGDKIELEKSEDGQILGIHPVFDIVVVKP